MMKTLLMIVGLVLIAALGVGAWMVGPSYMAQREENHVCQLIYDEMRRELDNPTWAIFDTCEDALILPDGDGGYTLFSEFEIEYPRPTRYMFSGTAWKSLAGWEIKISGYFEMTP
jgi:hypothetical protein